MKAKQLIYSPLFFLLLALTSLNLKAEINWFHGTFEEAIASAKEENKMLFLDFYATWCGPCKYMEKNIFPDPNVINFFDKNLVAIKVDIDNENELSKKFGVTAVPTYIILKPEENLQYIETGRIVGSSKNAELFLDNLKNAITTLDDLLNKLSNDPGNKETITKIFNKYFEQKNIEKMKEYYLYYQNHIKNASCQELIELRMAIPETMNNEKMYDAAINETNEMLTMSCGKAYQEVLFKIQRRTYELNKNYQKLIETQRLIINVTSSGWKFSEVFKMEYYFLMFFENIKDIASRDSYNLYLESFDYLKDAPAWPNVDYFLVVGIVQKLLNNYDLTKSICHTGLTYFPNDERILGLLKEVE